MTDSPEATISSHFNHVSSSPCFPPCVPIKLDETDRLLQSLSRWGEEENSASFTHVLRLELEQTRLHFHFSLCVIAVSPKITEISSDISINEGGNVSLTCIATGRPDPTITWRHISPKGKSRTRTEARREGDRAVCEPLGRRLWLIHVALGLQREDEGSPTEVP